jgi:hypothetical protein
LHRDERAALLSSKCKRIAGARDDAMTSIPLVTWYKPMRRRPRPSLWRQQLRWLPIWWHALWART